MEKKWTPTSAAEGVEQALKILEGRWKLVILFHLFGGRLLRFSDLERAIPAITQKMLIQQLRQMEKDGVVRRIVHHQVPRAAADADWSSEQRTEILDIGANVGQRVHAPHATS